MDDSKKVLALIEAMKTTQISKKQIAQLLSLASATQRAEIEEILLKEQHQNAQLSEQDLLDQLFKRYREYNEKLHQKKLQDMRDSANKQPHDLTDHDLAIHQILFDEEISFNIEQMQLIHALEEYFKNPEIIHLLNNLEELADEAEALKNEHQQHLSQNTEETSVMEEPIADALSQSEEIKECIEASIQHSAAPEPEHMSTAPASRPSKSRESLNKAIYENHKRVELVLNKLTNLMEVLEKIENHSHLSAAHHTLYPHTSQHIERLQRNSMRLHKTQRHFAYHGYPQAVTAVRNTLNDLSINQGLSHQTPFKMQP